MTRVRDRIAHLGDQPVFLLLVLLAGTLFFLRLGTPGLFDADEPAYAQAAREMLERGDWVTPHFNGRPRFDKPILFYWLIMVSYRLFGITEFAVRFWSALAGIGVVILLWHASRQRYGRTAAFWTGVAFSTNLLTIVLARAAVTDMLLTFFVTAAILSGLDALDSSTFSDRWAVRVMWISMGLAVLVKGPIGLLIPIMALGGFLLLVRETRAGLRRLFPWEGPVLLLVVAVPWYAMALSANGWAFVEGFVIKHHVTRYTGVISSHAGPLWFYLPVILVGFFPWSAFLPAAAWRAGGIALGRRAETPGDRLAVACLCWVGGLFLFFSLAGTKLPSYLFPAFPAMALLVGRAIADDAAASGIPRWVSNLTPWAIGLTGGVLGTGLLLLPLAFDALRAAARGVLDGVAPPTGLTWALAGTLLLGTAGALLTRRQWRPMVLGVTASGLLLAAVLTVAPTAYHILQGSLREFAEEARSILRREEPVVLYGLNAPSVVFYAARPVKAIGAGAAAEVDAVVRPLREASRPAVVITRSSLVPELKDVKGLVLHKSRGGYALFVADSGH
jgi:4-amino-4-deoxy-L-arabinose transferase-like glycosyltransferase